jgi:hypothetical protein
MSQFLNSPNVLLQLLENYPINVNYKPSEYPPPLYSIAISLYSRPQYRPVFDALIAKGANPNIRVNGQLLLTKLVGQTTRKYGYFRNIVNPLIILILGIVFNWQNLN